MSEELLSCSTEKGNVTFDSLMKNAGNGYPFKQEEETFFASLDQSQKDAVSLMRVASEGRTFTLDEGKLFMKLDQAFKNAIVETLNNAKKKNTDGSIYSEFIDTYNLCNGRKLKGDQEEKEEYKKADKWLASITEDEKEELFMFFPLTEDKKTKVVIDLDTSLERKLELIDKLRLTEEQKTRAVKAVHSAETKKKNQEQSEKKERVPVVNFRRTRMSVFEKEMINAINDSELTSEIRKFAGDELVEIIRRLSERERYSEIVECLDPIVKMKEESFIKSYYEEKDYTLNETMVAMLQEGNLSPKVRELIKEKIYVKNRGLIRDQLKKFSTKDDGKMTMSDFEQECSLVFFQKAVDKFDVSRGAKFSTFATTVIHNYIVGVYTNKVNKSRVIEISLSTPVVDDSGSVKTLEDYQVDQNPTGEELVRRESEKEIIYEALNKLTLQQKFIAYCRYGLGGVPRKTQAEIAVYMNMSQANVSKIEGQLKKLVPLLAEAGMF